MPKAVLDLVEWEAAEAERFQMGRCRMELVTARWETDKCCRNF